MIHELLIEGSVWGVAAGLQRIGMYCDSDRQAHGC